MPWLKNLMSKSVPTMKHAEITDRIIGVFYEVYNELGFGYLESVYENALVIALAAKGLAGRQQIPIPVSFRGHLIGNFTADILVDDLVLLELKVARAIDETHRAQLMNYLRATRIEVGLILNFGPKPEVKRMVLDNERKRNRFYETKPLISSLLEK
jgi:GxxExxY protein